MNNKAVLFSIKPKYVSLISSGTKRYELRRKCPKVNEGDLALVYASTPKMCLVGAFVIGAIIQEKKSKLWEQIGKHTGVSRTEFMQYFDGCKLASALEISNYWSLEQSISLQDMREFNNIEPPQSYRYLCQETTGQLLSQNCNLLHSLPKSCKI